MKHKRLKRLKYWIDTLTKEDYFENKELIESIIRLYVEIKFGIL